MRLATFIHRDRQRIGVVDGNDIIDVALQAGAPESLRALLERGAEGSAWIRKAVSCGPRVPISDVRLCAPIPSPQKFLALGGNYASHLAEAASMNLVRAEGQVWFNKQVSCIAGPYDEVEKPFVSDQLDYEGELGVII